MRRNKMFSKNELVRHKRYGEGRVLSDMGETVVIRFGQRIEECLKEDLTQLPTLIQRMSWDEWDVPLKVINRTQAATIYSINNVWGIFARSRIELLPHQIWVCRQVNKDWPTRWLVADDVGLGKTIEAGLILTPLISSGKVKRLLIICPASLVEQWQVRLRTMFDIRAALYVTEADTENTAFWETHNQVIASLHTLRLDRGERHQRLLDSEPWDLVIVDEGHHLNADEKQGPTLGYQLVKKLQENARINSMLFFTGTPHRGVDFGFVSLLHLLRPDLFDPKHSLTEQLAMLRNVMIRNNKYNVTDLKGNLIFQEPIVNSETYEYSDSEDQFYKMLSDFIIQGRAYASSLNEKMGSAVMLVLISMQKLASSSVAAIRRAIKGRLERIQSSRDDLENLQSQIRRYQELENIEPDNETAQDRMAQMEEGMATISSQLRLVENEESALQELLNAAIAIDEETKINKILEVLEAQYQNRNVLFFTEYKATQSLLMSALIKKFGNKCVTFINGDERADDVVLSDGSTEPIYKTKKEAENDFNSGKVRFLVSTEAGGEGIDLQESCYSLIHVDLPWNPMRMHQRVGRLNRYGQTRQVEVMTLRNPDTVETRIWDKLNEKIDRINSAFREVMEEPEDILQLVLGMTSPTFFRDIFADGSQMDNEGLSDWFDGRTATFGGKDAIETVRDLVGNVNRFDFREVSDQIPRTDLQDLRPFIESALVLNGRRVTREKGGGLSFKTPAAWRVEPAIRDLYFNMIFDRKDRSEGTAKRLLGVGHKAIDQALKQSRERNSAIATISEKFLSDPIIIFRVIDRVTDGPAKSDMVVGLKIKNADETELVRDWELLKYLNMLPLRKDFMRENSQQPQEIEVIRKNIDRTTEILRTRLDNLSLDFRVPDIELLSVLWPV